MVAVVSSIMVMRMMITEESFSEDFLSQHTADEEEVVGCGLWLVACSIMQLMINGILPSSE
jgi:hypothetical protein